MDWEEFQMRKKYEQKRFSESMSMTRGMYIEDIHMSNGTSFAHIREEKTYEEETNIFDDEFMSKFKTMFGNQHRRIGKTYAMAKVLVEIALETGEAISLIDHNMIFGGRSGHDEHHMLSMMRRVIDEYQFQKGINIRIIDFHPRGIRLEFDRYTANDAMRTYHKHRIPYFEPQRLAPKKKVETDLLLITCIIC